MTLMSDEIEEQLKLVLEPADIMNRPNRMICVTLLRYSLNKPERSHAQVHFFQKKAWTKLTQFFNEKHVVEQNKKLIDVMKFVYDKVSTNQHFTTSITSFCKFFISINSPSARVMGAGNISDSQKVFLRLKEWGFITYSRKNAETLPNLSLTLKEIE